VPPGGESNNCFIATDRYGVWYDFRMVLVDVVRFGLGVVWCEVVGLGELG
jgi:hypothetical protein